MRKVIPFRKRTSSGQRLSSSIVPMWDFSSQIDLLIRDAMIQGTMSPEEVAANIANRLGAFIRTHHDPEKILEFCLETVKKYSQD